MTKDEKSLYSLLLSLIIQQKANDEPQQQNSLEKWKQMATAVPSIISINETVEDISSQDLLFVTVDAYLAQELTKSPFQNKQQRINQLEMAAESLARFYSLIVQLEIMKEADIEKSRNRFLTLTEFHAKTSDDGVFKYSMGREEKVAQFKQAKELQVQLNEYFSQIGNAQQQLDDEEMRKFHLLLIKDALKMADDCSDMLKMEYRMLTVTSAGADAPVPPNPRPTRALNGPLMDQKGKVQRPFVITNRSQQLDNVFKPGHRLPTLSIDEYLKREFERGNVIMPSAAEEQKNGSGDEDEKEEDIYKQREWDNFKDENPRGWGNQNVNRG